MTDSPLLTAAKVGGGREELKICQLGSHIALTAPNILAYLKENHTLPRVCTIETSIMFIPGSIFPIFRWF